MLIYILFGILILVAVVVLFVLFIPNKIVFNFTTDFWEYRFSNIFFKHYYSSKDKEHASTSSATLDATSVTEPVEVTKANEQTQHIRSKSGVEENKNENREKSEASTPLSHQAEDSGNKYIDDDFPKEQDDRDSTNSTTNSVSEPVEDKDGELNWLERFHKLWEEDGKLVISLMKFAIKALKHSQKLLSPSKIELNLSGGFENPAETGWLYSLFVMINSYFEDNEAVEFDFLPVFTKEDWKFNGFVMYRFSLAKLLLFVLILLISSPYIQIIKAFLRNRKQK